MVASVTSRLRKPPPAAVPVAVEDAVGGVLSLIAGGAGLSAGLPLAPRRRRGRLWYWRPDLAMYQIP